MTNFSCLGISPGKSPFRTDVLFSLQSGQGVEAAGPKYIFGHVPKMVTSQPKFNPIGQGTTAADLPHAQGMAARPLGEVLDLILPNPPYLSRGAPELSYYKVFPETH